MKMKKIKRIRYSLDASMQRSMSASAHQLVAVGTIIFVSFPLLYFIWTVLFPQPYEHLGLRLFGSLLGLGLILTPYWPASAKAFMPWYWFLTILYTLPFLFTYLFLMNNASDVSAMSLLCGAFLLVLLLDLFSLSVLLFVGLGLAIVCYYLTATPHYIGEEHLEIGLVLLFVVIAGSTVNYKTAMMQQQRLAGMAAAAGMIAHELRTPLLGIKSGAQALTRYTPILFDVYKLAKEHGILSSTIRSNRLLQLEEASERISSEVDYANTIIDMLLIKAGRENTLQNCELEPCSMADCLKEAIDRYPFRSLAVRDKVSWEGDFQFMGSRVLMQHVIFNLLKNALYVIAKMQRGKITIWTKSVKKKNYLYVQDTAKGMTQKQLSRLFDHFYTTTFMGTGIGLSFCKLVMNRFGGDIECESKYGEYTLFILSFPLINNSN